jgi:hypothetical protein
VHPDFLKNCHVFRRGFAQTEDQLTLTQAIAAEQMLYAILF